MSIEFSPIGRVETVAEKVPRSWRSSDLTGGIVIYEEYAGRTDFRDDVSKVDVPTLVIHGDSDAIVPFEVSGKRSHEAIENSELALIEGGPHGLNATHAEQFNRALLDFIK